MNFSIFFRWIFPIHIAAYCCNHHQILRSLLLSSILVSVLPMIFRSRCYLVCSTYHQNVLPFCSDGLLIFRRIQKQRSEIKSANTEMVFALFILWNMNEIRTIAFFIFQYRLFQDECYFNSINTSNKIQSDFINKLFPSIPREP